MGKRILVVSQYYPPDVTAAAFRIGETVSILRKDGFSVTVLTAVPHRTHGGNIPNNNDDDVVRVPIGKIKSGGAKSYIFHYISFMVNSFLSFAATNRFKIYYFGLGPTEFRLAIIIANTFILYLGKPILRYFLPITVILSLLALVLNTYQIQRMIWQLDMREKAKRLKK